MQVEWSTTTLLTIDEVEKVECQKIASFIGHVFQLTNAALIDKLIQQEKLHHLPWAENSLFQFCLTITTPFSSFLSRGNETLLKSCHFHAPLVS